MKNVNRFFLMFSFVLAVFPVIAHAFTFQFGFSPSGFTRGVPLMVMKDGTGMWASQGKWGDCKNGWINGIEVVSGTAISVDIDASTDVEMVTDRIIDSLAKKVRERALDNEDRLIVRCAVESAKSVARGQ